ncbi:hypothetical protein CR513_45554, partial [Mucuna pruriens]
MFLSHKYECLKVFYIFYKHVQNEKGINIASIISDHGGEFENENFQHFFKEHGIHYNFSYPKTPQHNDSFYKRLPVNYGRVNNPTFIISILLDENLVSLIQNLITEHSFDTKQHPKHMEFITLGLRKLKSPYTSIEDRVKTRSTFEDQAQVALLSEVEPKNIEKALLDDRWMFTMQEELD